jgi:hypothetical protein
MVAPSPALLAHWHKSFSIIHHRSPGNFPWHNGPEATNDGPLSNNVSLLAGWLATIDLYYWPYMNYMHSEAALPDVLASVSHSRRWEQREYMARQARESAPRVAAALQRAVAFARRMH